MKETYKDQPLFDPTPYEVADAQFRSKSPINTEELSHQNKQIYTYLLTGKTITTLKAMKKFGIMRLASRINELRGVVEIFDRWISLDDGTRIKEYSLKPFEEEK
jgi:hypothetical protein